MSEGKIVLAFSGIQTLLSRHEFDLRLEVEDETEDGRRAFVFHGKENGGTCICSVFLSVDSYGILCSIKPDWREWFFPSEVSADKAGVHALIDKCWMEILDDDEDIVMLDDDED